MQREDVVRFLFGDVERGGASSRVSPRGPPDPVGFVLLLAAAFCSLPAIYLLLAHEAPPYAALSTGLVAMGLAWAGGCALEGRRRRTVLGLASAGIFLAVAVLLVPEAPRLAGIWVPLGAVSVLSALALVSVGRKRSGRGA